MNQFEEHELNLVYRLLRFIGEDPHREGLTDTPKRFLTAWQEWTWGYSQDPVAVLKTFSDGAEDFNEMVIVHDIPVVSKCEHHLADILGVAHVGYIPNKRIVGLSKLPRIVNILARRLQVQERLTTEIADVLWKGLSPLGVGVVLHCSHACMSTRGINIHGSFTTTSAMRGSLFEDAMARNEFMALCRRNGV